MDPALMMCFRCQRRVRNVIRRSFSVQSHSLLQRQGPTRNYYQVLGVTKAASASDIKTAYIKLSKKLHPDIRQSPGDQEDVHESFVELNQAYGTLSKPLSRREYDHRLAHPGVQPVGVRVRRASAADPYGAQQPGEADWYRDLGGAQQGGARAGSEEDNYYGIRGVRRVRSIYIVYGCLAFLVVGAAVHFIIFRTSSDYVISRLDEKDRKIAMLYNEAKERAMRNGNKKQMELLRAKRQEYDLKMKQE